tara:strand:- start:2153 stop:2953 length:801 start_codon:yes stop_codon:yes gene_type:complete
MKKLYTLLTAVTLTASAFAQAPEKMSYQAVIRDAGNALVTSQALGIQISILQGGATGTAVYVETQTSTTNTNGLVSLEIGVGTVVSGNFTTINWGNDTYFIKTETDLTGGTSYNVTGISQLMSVPYALYAKTAGEKTYTIGLHPELGGYVFRISSDGKHGLVAETQDQSISEEWHESKNVINDPANHSIDGAKFMDWRLPTKFELNEIYLQNAAIGGFSTPYPDKYCSSMLYDLNETYVWVQRMGSGTQFTNIKTSNTHVRAVRAF